MKNTEAKFIRTRELGIFLMNVADALGHMPDMNFWSVLCGYKTITGNQGFVHYTDWVVNLSYGYFFTSIRLFIYCSVSKD